ncbi:hypothetical protein KIPB_005215 [Kipferlia bialata]|uniref:Uncharacterized protein n=1 Tax=Kipferlia bialata TaxID=797122 RepID=A0A9K3CV12_9EUKA|nr:hypothetical protein KIPB_005215 [Kipferlia bialata]|eukprot:g5215.t1
MSLDPTTDSRVQDTLRKRGMGDMETRYPTQGQVELGVPGFYVVDPLEHKGKTSTLLAIRDVYNEQDPEFSCFVYCGRGGVYPDCNNGSDLAQWVRARVEAGKGTLWLFDEFDALQVKDLISMGVSDGQVDSKCLELSQEVHTWTAGNRGMVCRVAEAMRTHTPFCWESYRVQMVSTILDGPLGISLQSHIRKTLCNPTYLCQVVTGVIMGAQYATGRQSPHHIQVTVECLAAEGFLVRDESAYRVTSPLFASVLREVLVKLTAPNTYNLQLENSRLDMGAIVKACMTNQGAVHLATLSTLAIKQHLPCESPFHTMMYCHICNVLPGSAVYEVVSELDVSGRCTDIVIEGVGDYACSSPVESVGDKDQDMSLEAEESCTDRHLIRVVAHTTPKAVAQHIVALREKCSGEGEADVPLENCWLLVVVPDTHRESFKEEVFKVVGSADSVINLIWLFHDVDFGLAQYEVDYAGDRRASTSVSLTFKN